MTDITTNKTTSDRLFSLFRAVALVEGLTTLALFFVAMPIKYTTGDASWVKVMGPVHGYAFVAYLIMMGVALNGRDWSTTAWVRTTLASFFPFGTFLNDPYLKRLKAADDAKMA